MTTEPQARIPWDVAKWILSILLSAISLLGTGFIAYSQNDKSISNRISVVETQRAEDAKRLERIENKVDRLLERSVK